MRGQLCAPRGMGSSGPQRLAPAMMRPGATHPRPLFQGAALRAARRARATRGAAAKARGSEAAVLALRGRGSGGQMVLVAAAAMAPPRHQCRQAVAKKAPERMGTSREVAVGSLRYAVSNKLTTRASRRQSAR